MTMQHGQHVIGTGSFSLTSQNSTYLAVTALSADGDVLASPLTLATLVRQSSMVGGTLWSGVVFQLMGLASCIISTGALQLCSTPKSWRKSSWGPCVTIPS